MVSLSNAFKFVLDMLECDGMAWAKYLPWHHPRTDGGTWLGDPARRPEYVLVVFACSRVSDTVDTFELSNGAAVLLFLFIYIYIYIYVYLYIF